MQQSAESPRGGQKTLLVDALELLRLSFQQGLSMKYNSTESTLAFTAFNVVVSAEAPCRWCNRHNNPFSVGSLWLFLTTDYSLKEADKYGFQFVSVLEKKPLRDYLSSPSCGSFHSQLDTSLPLTPAKLIDSSKSLDPRYVFPAPAASCDFTQQNETSIAPAQQPLSHVIPQPTKTAGRESPALQRCSAMTLVDLLESRKVIPIHVSVFPCPLDCATKLQSVGAAVDNAHRGVGVDQNSAAAENDSSCVVASSDRIADSRTNKTPATVISVSQQQIDSFCSNGQLLVNRSFIPGMTVHGVDFCSRILPIVNSCTQKNATQHFRKRTEPEMSTTLHDFGTLSGLFSTAADAATTAGGNVGDRENQTRKGKSTSRNVDETNFDPSSLAMDQKRARLQSSFPKSMLQQITHWKSKPIILVPTASSSSQSIINFTSAKYFFTNRKFPLPLNARNLATSAGLSDSLQSSTSSFTWCVAASDRRPSGQLNGPQRNDTGDPLPHGGIPPLYLKVVDMSKMWQFQKLQWYCTTAVFLQGAEWQFTGWPFRSYSDLFSVVKGYYVAFEDETLPKFVKEWPIKVLRAKRHSRHDDTSIWFQFVESYEEFLSRPRDFKKFDFSAFNIANPPKR